MYTDRLITILGPTASGKTGLAVALADAIDAEIISGDSRQVYESMDLGTGKDLEDYEINGRHIPYHLINIRKPGYKYNLFEYQEDFNRVYSDLRERKVNAILCGGTGLYIESVLKGYKLLPVPENSELRKRLEGKSLDELTHILSQYKTLHNTTDVDTAKRAVRAIEIEEYYRQNNITERFMPEVDSVIFGVDIDRESRRRKITERLHDRFDRGMVGEVENILKSGVKPEDLIYYGLEYKYITLYVTGQYTYDEMFRALETAIHQFAKRQMTWFRGMERRGFCINWIDYDLPVQDKVDYMLETLKLKSKNTGNAGRTEQMGDRL